MENILYEDFRYVAEQDLPWEEFKNKTFLITGATGLIGSLMARFLLYANKNMDLNCRVVAVVRDLDKAKKIFAGRDFNEPEYIVADLSSDEISLEGSCDHIIHAAAVTASKTMVSEPVKTIMTAIEGTEKMLALAVEKNTESFVYISSMEIYGQPDSTGKTAEKDLGYVDIGTVRSCYPEGKRICECLCTAYASQYGLKVMSARLAQTFGAGIMPGENRVFAQFARSAMRGEDIVLHTTGESEGNYVYTADVIWAILLLLARGQKGEAYNIANEESHTTIRNMAELVMGEFGGADAKVVIDIPQDSGSLGYAPPVKMHLDASKMASLGWKANTGLAEAYRRMICWLKTDNMKEGNA